MLRNYPLLVADGRRLQQVGVDRWMTEQEARAAAGFAYADIQFPEQEHG